MIKCNLNELKQGMILAKEVCNFQNVLLLKKGSELKRENIRILKCWGIAHVYIEGEDKEHHEAYLENDYEIKKRAKKISDKFSGVLDNKIMVEILRIAEKQAVKRYLKKKTQQNEIS